MKVNEWINIQYHQPDNKQLVLCDTMNGLMIMKYLQADLVWEQYGTGQLFTLGQVMRWIPIPKKIKS